MSDWQRPAELKLLSGGNPQVPKGDGAEPVEYYLDSLPGWKRTVGRRLDELIVATVPDVRKAVRWNTPFYGVEGQGWFVGFHALTNYIKVSFTNGSSLEPPPPVDSKDPATRYLHVDERGFDEDQFVAWVQQASELPGWDGF